MYWYHKTLPAFSILPELATWTMNTLATSFSGGQYTNQAAVLPYSSGAQWPVGVGIPLSEHPANSLWQCTACPGAVRNEDTRSRPRSVSSGQPWPGQELFQCFLMKEAGHHTALPRGLAAQSCLICQPVLEGNCHVSNSEKSVSRLAAVLWRLIKSNSAPYFNFFPPSH